MDENTKRELARPLRAEENYQRQFTAGGTVVLVRYTGNQGWVNVSVRAAGVLRYSQSHSSDYWAVRDFAERAARVDLARKMSEAATRKPEATPGTAKVILFKPSGKYYTEEEWRVPVTVPDSSPQRGEYTRETLVPSDMRHSPDFRCAPGWTVLVPTQEPWGYPCLIMGESS